jgi:tetratricopeptide (TPR) repeat protein
MILMKSSSFTKTEFKKVKKEFDEIIKKVSGPLTTGYMYRNLGKAYFSLEDYPLSQRYYKKVLTYHHDEKSISFVYMRLGDIKKEQGHYDDAWNYYIKAEKLLSDEDTTVYHVYDEYAKYYLYKEEYEQANKYMDRIFNNSEWLISSLDHSFVVTYNQVKDKLKKYDDIEKVLKRLLNELNSGYIYASHHLDKFGGTVSLLDCPDSTLERFLRIAVGFQQKNNLSRGMNKIVKMFLGDIVIQMKKDI